MDARRVMESLEHKNILITGSTGFLGKIFVEKVLRVQPKVNKLFLLVRADDPQSAAKRWQNEVLQKDVFKVLRETYGVGFDSFVSEKVTPIAGDIARENLGIHDPQLIWSQINIVVNIAATTRFDERYDVALGINALGAKNVAEFSNKCRKLEMLLHVSTAYVAGEKTGHILETPFNIGDALNESSTIDIEAELKLVSQRPREVCSDQSTKRAERTAMKELGMSRARSFGWPNTYVFTKALGEMLLGHFKGNYPLAIMRPTIITSTYREPFPGWMEGNRTIDSFIIAYARGNLTSIMVDPGLTMDVVPGDMVVNAMLVVMASHSSKGCEPIYHVCSSMRNPMKYAMLEEYNYNYFLVNPRKGKDGKPIKTRRVTLYKSKAHFKLYMHLCYKLPLEVFGMVNAAFCNLFKRQYTHLRRKYNFVMRLVYLYEPYVFFKGIFDDKNLDSLREAVLENEEKENIFDFDTKNINWEDYFKEIHIPSVLKYVYE